MDKFHPMMYQINVSDHKMLCFQACGHKHSDFINASLQWL
jgi:hypothetical protein